MHADDQAPHVVIVGGYLTMPLFYWPMRRRLLERGAARVSIAQLYWPDWMAATFAGFGPSLLRAGRAIREARSEASAPPIVIGHSMGGLISRLAMSPVPFDGRHVGVADDVGCLVTLGTPHTLYPTIPYWKDHPGIEVTEFLGRVSPGAFFAPTTGYLTVGSTLVRPAERAPTNSLKHVVNRTMSTMVGQTEGIGGDGIVGDDLAQLDRVRHISLPDVLHGTFGGPWYGDGHVMDRWWPAALEEWHRALAARDS
jgi:hypothetical protein